MVRLRVAVVVVAVVIVLSIVFAFIWPGWAIRSTTNEPLATASASASASPTISASALPDNATTLLKSMPDSVSTFARTKADAATTWQSAEPLEEYTLVYSDGTDVDDVTLTVAQWSDSDGASGEYGTLTGALTGKTIASGLIKVDGNKTGEYVVAYDGDSTDKAVAYWYNDTVLFEATGAVNAVETVFEYFPM
ncbi:hypothetical protein F6S87_03095 [Bifidobacterium sp. BRDM6]|uniref:Uncharacterized protein n=2 Tax=Bifidobacterium choloepi TaxID=2614131 RepID=A0A6I5NAY9_9BIFI|nr:hypothetical protein [Bifidobacterium choloepi]NEG69620.1 hypothetical protein [Bifidobacterium choloepi]